MLLTLVLLLALHSSANAVMAQVPANSRRVSVVDSADGCKAKVPVSSRCKEGTEVRAYLEAINLQRSDAHRLLTALEVGASILDVRYRWIDSSAAREAADYVRFTITSRGEGFRIAKAVFRKAKAVPACKGTSVATRSDLLAGALVAASSARAAQCLLQGPPDRDAADARPHREPSLPRHEDARHAPGRRPQ